jgi:hypothetical protein
LTSPGQPVEANRKAEEKANGKAGVFNPCESNFDWPETLDERSI